MIDPYDVVHENVIAAALVDVNRIRAENNVAVIEKLREGIPQDSGSCPIATSLQDIWPRALMSVGPVQISAYAYALNKPTFHLYKVPSSLIIFMREFDQSCNSGTH